MEFFKFLWAHPIYILWIYLLIINIVAFAAMGLDKRRANKGKWRIAEGTLFLLTIIGGSIGGIGGIYAFHHKTLHKQFTIGFPIILVLQLALGVFIFLSVK